MKLTLCLLLAVLDASLLLVIDLAIVRSLVAAVR